MNIKDYFGLDIGKMEIKAAWLEKNDEAIKLLACGMGVNNGGEGWWERSEGQTVVAETVKKLTADLGIKVNRVVVSLPELQVITRVIETPVLTNGELESAMKWEAEQYIPVSIEEVYWRYQVLTAGETKMDVLLVAAPNKLVDGYIKTLSLAGLETVGIETEILAISRSLVTNDPYSPTTMIVNLGALTTDLSVVRKGSLTFVRSISTGSEAVTRAVSLGLGLETGQAEEYKKTYGMETGQMEGKIAMVIKPVMEAITAEIKKVIVYYQSKCPDDPIKRVAITGGMARMPGLIGYFGNELVLEVQMGNPLGSIVKTEEQAKVFIQDGPAYAAAVGLALKTI